MAKTIPLTRGYVAIVDDEDYERLKPYRWHCRLDGKYLYAARSIHVRLGLRQYTSRPMRMHREIMEASDSQTVDHINGNTLDNRRCNLRFCSHAGNLQNVGKTTHRKGKPTTSQYKGVYWESRINRWAAQIMANRKRVTLGTHATEEEAALAYDEAARRLHGEFARPNFPT